MTPAQKSPSEQCCLSARPTIDVQHHGRVHNLTDNEQTTSISADTFRSSDQMGYQTYSHWMPRMFGVDDLN